MAHEIQVPEVGESISEVVVGEWLKQDGDYIEIDESICEIESDKASFEVPADKAGVLHPKAAEGDTLAVGDVLAVIDTDQEKPSKSESAGEKSKDSEESTEASEEEEKLAAPEREEEKETVTRTKADTEGVKISPVAQNILSEAGISPSDVKGSGIGGKITKSDAQKAVEARGQKEEAPKAEAKPEPEKPSPQPKKETPQLKPAPGSRNESRKRMSTLRQTIANRLVESKNQTAMLTTFNEIEMSEVKMVRAKYKEIFKEKHEVGLGFMSFFVKAAVLALQEFPLVNAYIDENEIVYHDYCDVSIAVSTDRGLVVPVIRNAESLSMAQIEEQVVALATKARDNQLAIEEMRGGTFTITNGGIFGSLMSTPIINQPQSAILGMHAIQDRPVARDGEVVIRPMMYVTMSYDHRIIDGKESVQFLYRIKELVEDPVRLLLDV